MSTAGPLHDAPERALRSLFLGLSHRRSLGRLAVRAPITRPMVGRFVAGQALPEVLGALERLRESGFMTTVDVLGESVSSAEACAVAAGRYEETLAALSERGLERNVSLKLTQMGLDISEDVCRETVARVMQAAVAVGAFVRIDMEDHTKTDRTLGLWRELRSINPATGVVIQAALRRSGADVETLIADGARVRLCKGAYNEPAAVAFKDRKEVQSSYSEMLKKLFAQKSFFAVATHDDRLQDEAKKLAAGTSADFEFEMLRGIREDLGRKLLNDGYRLSVYLPYGANWLPYGMRRMKERKRNILLLFRALFS